MKTNALLLLFLPLSLLLSLSLSLPLQAGTYFPGGLKLGSESPTCNETNIGYVRFDAATGNIEKCGPTGEWNSVSGESCSDISALLLQLLASQSRIEKALKPSYIQRSVQCSGHGEWVLNAETGEEECACDSSLPNGFHTGTRCKLCMNGWGRLDSGDVDQNCDQDVEAPYIENWISTSTHEAGNTFPDPTEGLEVYDNDNRSESLQGISINSTHTSLPLSTVGVHTFSVYVTDVSGNTREYQQAVTIIDTTPPTLSLLSPNLSLSASLSIEAAAQPWTGPDQWSWEVWDNADGDVEVTVHNPLTLNNHWRIPGTYTVLLEAQDAAGNLHSVEVPVNVVDTTAPSLALLGDNPLVLEAGTGFSDPGATVIDIVDGEMVIQADVGESEVVDVRAVGTYTLIYSHTDTHGNPSFPLQLSRTVEIVDTQAPVIAVQLNIVVEEARDEAYVDNNTVVTDGQYNHTAEVDVSEVDLLHTGIYNVYISASDLSGNTAMSTYTVSVVDTTNPTVEIRGDTEVTVTQYTAYTDAGAYATDNAQWESLPHNGSFAYEVSTVGTVDTTIPGVYTLSYVFIDGQGLAGSADRTVTVECEMLVPLGMEDGEIFNSQISASSSHAHCNHIYGRLNIQGTTTSSPQGGWCAIEQRLGDTFTVDLLVPLRIHAVDIQARWDSDHQYITQYALEMSNPVSDTIKDENGQQRVFPGLAAPSQTTTVRSYIYGDRQISSRDISLRVLGYNSHPSMRVELYQCAECNGVNVPLGMESGEIGNAYLSATSSHAHCNVIYGRKNMVGTWNSAPQGGWCASEGRTGDSMTIDLRNRELIREIGTQGRYDADQWVTQYRVEYRSGGSWVSATVGGSDVLVGNTDFSSRHTEHINTFDQPILARRVRITVLAYQGHPSMRVELYGCKMHD